MDAFLGMIQVGVSFGCRVNRVCCTYLGPIIDDVRAGCPRLVSGQIPSKYEVRDEIPPEGDEQS